MLRQKTRGRLRRTQSLSRGQTSHRQQHSVMTIAFDVQESRSSIETSTNTTQVRRVEKSSENRSSAVNSRRITHTTLSSSSPFTELSQSPSFPRPHQPRSTDALSTSMRDHTYPSRQIPTIQTPTRSYMQHTSQLVPGSNLNYHHHHYTASQSTRFFSTTAAPTKTTESTDTPQVEVKKSAFEAVADPSARKTWLQIYSDMKIRSYQGHLPEKISKNDKRVKARQQHMSDVVCGPELIAKLMKVTPTQQVWLRKQGTKGQALVTFKDAIRIAQEEELDLVGVRSCITNPPKDNPKMQVEDDGVIPLIIMDYRMLMEDLYLKDTVQAKSGSSKDINLTVNITRDDLYRKIEQCIEFMMDGNQVKFICKSKRLAKVEQMVQRNTSHISMDEINAKTEALMNKNKSDTIDLAEFTRQTRQHHNDRALERIMSITPRLASESDESYKLRMEKLAIEERKAQAEEDKRQYQLQIVQTTEDIQEKIARVKGHITETEQTIKQTQNNLDTMIKGTERRANRGRGGRGRGGKGQMSDREALSIEKQKKEIKRLNATLAKYKQQLVAYDLKLGSLRKGILVSPNLDDDFFDFAPQDDDDDDFSALSRKRGAGGDDDDDFAINDDDDDGDDDDNERHRRNDSDSESEIDLDAVLKKSGSSKGDGDDGDFDLGGDNDGDGDAAAVGTDDEKDSDKKKKLTKRELDTQKQKNALSKMNVNQRLSYLAQVRKKTQYPVLGTVTEILAKLSAIVQAEREARKKSGKTLDSVVSDRFPQSVVDSMSNKERKRYLARIAREDSDPNFALKAELHNAMKLLQSDDYIINDALYEKFLKKSFWYVHDGGDQQNIVKNPSFHIRMTGMQN